MKTQRPNSSVDPLFVSPFAKGEIQWGFWQFLLANSG